MKQSLLLHGLGPFKETISLCALNCHMKCWLTFFFFLNILFIHDTHTHTEAETQAEGEAGSMQGARRGTRSQVSRIMPWAEGVAKPLSHLGCPLAHLLNPSASLGDLGVFQKSPY